MVKDVLLPLASAIAACVAAYFALQPSKVQVQEHAASISDVPELYILNNRIAISELSNPNRRAGWWAIAAATLSATAPLWSFVQYLYSAWN